MWNLQNTSIGIRNMDVEHFLSCGESINDESKGSDLSAGRVNVRCADCNRRLCSRRSFEYLRIARIAGEVRKRSAISDAEAWGFRVIPESRRLSQSVQTRRK
ncbi:hypothetical protein ANTQUA_LOCUS5730 [Anthophora quadrimaculata]